MKDDFTAKIPKHGSQARGSRRIPFEHSMTQGDPAVGAAEHRWPGCKMIEGKAAAQEPRHAASNGLVTFDLNSNLN